MKFLAALIIISGCWCIGQSKNARLLYRLSSLRALHTGLGIMEGEIRGRLATLPEALSAASRFSPFFKKALCYIEETDVEAAFREAAAKALDGEDEQEILSHLGAGLLAPEETSLIASLSHARERLHTLCQTLEGENRRLGKLYTGAGAAAGLLAVILLF